MATVGLLALTACIGPAIDAGDVSSRSQEVVRNPSYGGPASTLEQTHACYGGGVTNSEYCTTAVAPDVAGAFVATPAAAQVYLDRAARNWGCTVASLATTVSAPDEVGGWFPNFTRTYGKTSGYGTDCGTAFWNGEKQAAFFMPSTASGVGLANGTTGLILAKYTSLNGAGGVLGPPISNPVAYGTYQSTYQLYKHGIITHKSGDASAYYAANHAVSSPSWVIDPGLNAILTAYLELHGVAPGIYGSVTPGAGIGALMQDTKETCSMPGQVACDPQLRAAGDYLKIWDTYYGTTAYVLARKDWTSAYVVRAPQATVFDLTALGFPQTALLQTAMLGGAPLFLQQFERGAIAWRPNNCALPGQVCTGAATGCTQYGTRWTNYLAIAETTNKTPKTMFSSSAAGFLCDQALAPTGTAPGPWLEFNAPGISNAAGLPAKTGGGHYRWTSSTGFGLWDQLEVKYSYLYGNLCTSAGGWSIEQSHVIAPEYLTRWLKLPDGTGLLPNNGLVGSVLTGNGYVEFQNAHTPTYEGNKAIGLNPYGPAYTYLTPRFTLKFTDNDGLRTDVYEEGDLKHTSYTTSGSHTYRIEVQNGSVSYKRDGVTFYTSTLAPYAVSSFLRVDVSFADGALQGYFSNVKLSSNGGPAAILFPMYAKVGAMAYSNGQMQYQTGLPPSTGAWGWHGMSSAEAVAQDVQSAFNVSGVPWDCGGGAEGEAACLALCTDQKKGCKPYFNFRSEACSTNPSLPTLFPTFRSKLEAPNQFGATGSQASQASVDGVQTFVYNLSRELTVAGAASGCPVSGTDKDGDCLDDLMEAQLAYLVAPRIEMDEGGDQNQGVCFKRIETYQVRPTTSPTESFQPGPMASPVHAWVADDQKHYLTIRYMMSYPMQSLEEFAGFVDMSGHIGDNEAVEVRLSSRDLRRWSIHSVIFTHHYMSYLAWGSDLPEYSGGTPYFTVMADKIKHGSWKGGSNGQCSSTGIMWSVCLDSAMSSPYVNHSNITEELASLYCDSEVPGVDDPFACLGGNSAYFEATRNIGEPGDYFTSNEVPSHWMTTGWPPGPYVTMGINEPRMAFFWADTGHIAPGQESQAYEVLNKLPWVSTGPEYFNKTKKFCGWKCAVRNSDGSGDCENTQHGQTTCDGSCVSFGWGSAYGGIMPADEATADFCYNSWGVMNRKPFAK